VGALTFKTSLQKRGSAAAVVLDEEQVRTIGEGPKREETRDRRVARALDMLRAGKTIS
jgi:hypothetical protein